MSEDTESPSTGLLSPLWTWLYSGDVNTRNTKLIVLTVVVMVGIPYVLTQFIFPALERRRIARDEAARAHTATDRAELEAARKRATAAAAAAYQEKALEQARRKQAERAAEADQKLKDLRFGMESHYATDDPRDLFRVRDVGTLNERRGRALEGFDAVQRTVVAVEAAKIAAAEAEAVAKLGRELAARRAQRAAREGADATPPIATKPTVSAPAPAPAAAAAAAPAPAPVPAPEPARPRKRALQDEELAAARKDVASLRVPSEPDAGEAPPAGAPQSAGPAIFSIVINSADYRGNFRLARRFRATDTLRTVMDVITATVPGGMAGRQLCTVHPRRVVATWRDYDLREYKFDVEFEELRAQLEGSGGGGSGSSGVRPAPWAPLPNPGGLTELRTLLEAGLEPRCALVLRPIDADAVHVPAA